jgi:hypothetical protein
MRQACGTQANLAPLLLGFSCPNKYRLTCLYIVFDKRSFIDLAAILAIIKIKNLRIGSIERSKDAHI